MSIEHQAISALKWSAISKAVSQLVTWSVTILVIRLLSPDDFGLMAISTVVISIVSGVADLGLGASIVQSRAIGNSELENLSGVLLAINIGFGLLVALAAPPVSALFHDSREIELIDVLRVSTLQFLFNAVAIVPQSIAYRNMRFKWIAFVDAATGLVTSLITLALAWWGAGVWALVLGNLTGAVCRTALLLARSGAAWPKFAFQGIGRHLSFGGKVTLATMAWQIGYQADVLIAGYFLTKGAVGIYSVAIQLATLPMDKLFGIINRVAFPTVARMQDDLPRLRGRLLDAIRLLEFAAIPVLWGLSAIAPELVTLAFGERWLGAIFPLQVVTLVIPVRMLSVILTTSVSALGRADVDLRNKLVNCAVLPLAFLAGIHWGINGLALTWVVAHPVVFYENFPGMSRVLGVKLRDIGAAVYGSIAAGLAMYAAVWGARWALGSLPDLYRLMALIAVGSVTYLSVALLLDQRIWVDVKRLAAASKG